uniref:Uncharacterized protein n=1 Tax=Romanomermis culicivorax TaxID=13658 RepID=A0A915KC31_ROMCU
MFTPNNLEGHTTNAYILIVYVAFWPQPTRQWTVSEDDWRAMRGIYRFSGRITLKNFENKPPKEGVYVTLQSCNVNSNDEHRCRGTATGVGWARTDKNGRWEIKKDFTASGLHTESIFYLNFGKSECRRTGQRVDPIDSQKVGELKNDRIVHRRNIVVDFEMTCSSIENL